MLVESRNEPGGCHTLSKNSHLENMMTISSQKQTVDPLQYLESIEKEFNNPIYQKNTSTAVADYMDEDDIPDREFDNPIYGSH